MINSSIIFFKKKLYNIYYQCLVKENKASIIIKYIKLLIKINKKN